MEHELKTDPGCFEAVARGAKTHEIRYNDRNFAVGDTLILRKTKYTGKEMKDGAPLEYEGEPIVRKVSHILNDYGLVPGWVILSFELPFMDHGIWHDRATGQHLYTQDQLDAERRAVLSIKREERESLSPAAVDVLQQSADRMRADYWEGRERIGNVPLVGSAGIDGVLRNSETVDGGM